MKRNKWAVRLTGMLLAGLLAFSLTACSQGEGASGTTEGEALTEQEYQDAVTKLSEDFTTLQTEAANIDTTDVDAAVELLESFKAPLEEFMAVVPPEVYSAAHEKLSSGSQAMIDYIDVMSGMVGETDQAKLEEATTQMLELVETAMADLTEGADLLASASAE